MTKKLYLIDSINGRKINASCHVSRLLPHIAEISTIETVCYDLDLDHFNETIEEINAKADIVFIIHDFTLWNDGSFDIDNGKFTRFIRALWSNKNVFVFPTELAPAAMIKAHFKENVSFMTKIIVASEAFRKIFLKIDSGLGVPTNKIKLISIPTDKFGFADATKLKAQINLNKRLIVTAGLLHPQKDYIELLRELQQLTKKYKNLVMYFQLARHPSVTFEQASAQFDEMQDFVEANKMQEFVRLSPSGTRNDYIQSLSVADLVVFPHDHSLDMYNGTMIDALAMGKAIVAPESLFAEDLVKKTGILLYRYKNDVSFYDACSVILENKDFRTILEQQNFEYGKTLTYQGIAQQYVNQIKRFKFN